MAVVLARENAIEVQQPAQNVFTSSDMREVVHAASIHIYFQLFLKVLITLIGLFLFVVVFNSISKDVEKEIQKILNQEEVDRKQCLKEFTDNKCDRDVVPPALRGSCETWKICSETAPTGIGKTKVAVRFFAQLINELVNPLSPKALVLFALVFAAWIMFPKN